MRNADFDASDIKATCETKLGIRFRSNGEFNGWFLLDGKRHARITIPKGRKDIYKGTYASMARQLRLDIGQFDNLLACPLTGEEYEAIQRANIEGERARAEGKTSSAKP